MESFHAHNKHTHTFLHPHSKQRFQEKSIESAKGQRRMEEEISLFKTFVDVE